ncbi:MAG: SRPBCC domain-containing protein [Planctomycetota bacterium]
MTATIAALRLSRSIRASREIVFDHLVSQDKLALWFGPDEAYEIIECRTEPRAGGSYRVAVRSPDGAKTHTVVGRYTEVEPPERVAYTWAWLGDDGEPGPESRVEIELTDEGGSTLLKMVHHGLPDEPTRTEHEHGWSGSLDRLVRLVEGQ